jgi:hypothetical protein
LTAERVRQIAERPRVARRRRSPTPERIGGLRKKPGRGQRKPLKRLDSDKEIKENPKAFLWRTPVPAALKSAKSGAVPNSPGDKAIFTDYT